MQKILIVEDEEDIREELVDWLTFEGYEVYGADDGQNALSLALEKTPDLIVSDVRMPRMNGMELLLEVRSHPDLYHIPFIFVTASADRNSVRNGMSLGADDYITKPFTLEEVLESVNSRLERQKKQTEAASTQVEQLQKALESEREQRMLKSRLVAMFSHDFRTPLALISSSAHLILNYEEKLGTAKKRKKLKQISKSVGVLTKMLDDMLLAAEMENDAFDPQLETINLTEFTGNLVDEFQDMHDETHTLNYNAAAPYILQLDRKLIRQIIINLLSNAVKYSSAGSEVVVTLQSVGENCALSVQDSGIGIPEEQIANLFDPFKRAENAKSVQGTGLGLALVKQAVDYCNGRIEVTSKLDEGSIFTVYLPLS